MACCDTCHNEYDKTFDVTYHGDEFTFDCFECAIQRLAPACENCRCRILGHGVEEQGKFFCGASCARAMGRTELRDRGDSALIELPQYP